MIRESAQLKTVLKLCDMEIHQNKSMPDDQKLKTMKRSMDPNHRLRNFVVKSHRGLSGVEKGNGICHQWKEKKPVFARRPMQLSA